MSEVEYNFGMTKWQAAGHDQIVGFDAAREVVERTVEWKPSIVPKDPWLNPTAVEVGQLWINDLGHIEARTERINSLDNGRAWFGSGFTIMAESMLFPANRWRCLGYQLDDGRRVMVGERWTHPGAPGRTATVTAIEHSGTVWFAWDDGNSVLMKLGTGDNVFGPTSQWLRDEQITEWRSQAALTSDEAVGAMMRARELLHERRGRLAILAGLFAAVGSLEVRRALARQRVDGAIAVYRGPFARAFGAALRGAAEVDDLTDKTIEQVVAKVLGFEAALQRGMRPARARQEVLDNYEWELVERALDVYERERAR